MQKSILKPIFTIVVIFILVGVFVYSTKTKTNVKEEIEQNTVVDLESNINAFMEAQVTPDDLGKDNYYCSNSIFGQDDKYVYAHVLCMGYEFNIKGELEPVSGSSLPVRFEYTIPGFRIIGYTQAPDGENNDSKWKEIFPGEYYDKAISGAANGEGKILEQKLKDEIKDIKPVFKNIEEVLKNIYLEDKNSYIQECIAPDKSVYYLVSNGNAYDGFITTLDAKGEKIGQGGGFTGKQEGTSLPEGSKCEVILATSPNIFGSLNVDKYHLK